MRLRGGGVRRLHFRLVPVGVDDRHLLERGGHVFHVVPDAQHQLLRHLRGHILHVAHGGEALLGEVALDDAGDGQLGGHQLHRLVLHRVLVVEHIDLYLRRGLVDAPGPPRRLPQREQLVAHAVEDERGKGVEVKARLHKGRVRDQHLHPGGEALLHPILPGIRLDFLTHDLRMVAVIRQELQQLPLGIRPHPARVDQHLFMGLDLPLHDLQHGFLFRTERVEIPEAGGFHKRLTVSRVQHRRLVVGLIRVDGEQIQIGRQNLLRDPPIRFQNLYQCLLHPVVFILDLFLQRNSNGDLLVIWQILSHVREGQERGLFQQEAGIDQRRYTGELPGFAVRGNLPAVGGVVAVLQLIAGLDDAVLRIEISGLGIAFAVLKHFRGHRPVQQMEDTGAVAVDKRGRHADDLLCCVVELAHGVALAAVVVVLVQLVADQAVQSPLVPVFKIGAQRIAPGRAHSREIPVRVQLDLVQLLHHTLVFGELVVFPRPMAKDPAIAADLDPIGLRAGVHCRPKYAAADRAFVVFLVLLAEKPLRRHLRVDPVAARYRNLDRRQALRAEESFLPTIPKDGGALHEAVPGLFLCDDGIDAFIALFVERVDLIQLRNALDDDAGGVRQGLRDLSHPLICHMGRAEDHVKGFWGLPGWRAGRRPRPWPSSRFWSFRNRIPRR